MGHADEETLAALALGEPVDDGVHAHVAGCPACRRQVEDLADLADLARSVRDDELVTPPESVWLAVAARLGDPAPNPSPAPSPADERSPSSSPGSGSHPARRSAPGSTPTRRRATGWLVAAAVALALGLGAAGGWALARRGGDRDGTVVASTALESLRGGSDRGSAEVLWTPGHTTLEVRADRLPPTGDGMHEVWLLNQDGRRMVSLGLLPGADRGSFPVPQRLLDEGYRVVDISVEPDDGDPAHSGVSVARGTLADG